MPTPAPYPLLFEPVILEKVWGGRRLGSLGKSLPKPDAKYGESWELADLGSTSASGAGGKGVRSVIANGPLKGRTIHEAIGAWGDALLHHGALTKDGAFPLLIKFLDAAEDLSVQVHPSPEYAAAHGDAHLKTECWYILDAEPGAKIYKGIRPGVSRDQFSLLARSGDAAIVDAMIALPAVPGECHNLPSGTVHALGAGVLVAEVQTPSDTTFRLYDWGRTGRELHIDAALECSDFSPPPPPVRFDKPGMIGGAVQTPWFSIVLYRHGRPASELGMHAGRVLIVVRGEGAVRVTGSDTSAFRFARGATMLVPHGIGEEWTIRSTGADQLEVLSVAIPTRTPKPDAAHA